MHDLTRRGVAGWRPARRARIRRFTVPFLHTVKVHALQALGLFVVRRTRFIRGLKCLSTYLGSDIRSMISSQSTTFSCVSQFT